MLVMLIVALLAVAVGALIEWVRRLPGRLPNQPAQLSALDVWDRR